MRIDVDANFKEIQNYFRTFGEVVVKKAVRRSLKRVGTSVVKETARDIRSAKLIQLSAKELKKRRMKVFMKLKGDIDDLVTRIYFGSKPENLGRYFAKQKVVRIGQTMFGDRRLGVQVRVPGKGAHIAPGAFFVGNENLKNAQPDYDFVMKRKGTARYGLVGAIGPSVSQLVASTGILSRSTKYASDRMLKEMESNLKYYLEKEGAGE